MADQPSIGFRPPRWLTVVLVLVFLKQLVLVAITPPWQIPDEPDHFSYVQGIVEHRQFPVFSSTAMDQSREVASSLQRTEAWPPRLGRHYPSGFIVNPSPGSDQAVVEDQRLPRNLAGHYGPAYYLYQTGPYLMASVGSVESRLRAMRVASSLLLVLLVYFSYQTVWAISRDAGLSLTVAVLVGWQPMTGHIFSGVTNDAGLAVLSGAVVWMFAAWLRQPPTWKQLLLGAVLVGITAVTKQPGWIWLPVGWLVLWWTRHTQPFRWWLVQFTAVVLVIGLLWTIREAALLSSLSSVPAGPSQPILPWTTILWDDLTRRLQVVFTSFWGHFGWAGLSTFLPVTIYRWLIVICLAALVGMMLVWRQPLGSIDRRVWLLWLVAWLCLEGFYQTLYWQRALTEGSRNFPLHGRYYLPLLIPFMTALAYGLGRLWWQRRQRVYVALGLGMVGLSIYSIYPVMWQLWHP